MEDAQMEAPQGMINERLYTYIRELEKRVEVLERDSHKQGFVYHPSGVTGPCGPYNHPVQEIKFGDTLDHPIIK